MNNTFHRFLSVLCLVALGVIGSPLAAQQASSAVTTGNASPQAAERARIVAYSADRVTETTQTLADGTRITHKSFYKFYQDSQGRSRWENFATKADTGEPDGAPRSISIYDPVAGVSYYLNPAEHTAERHAFRKVTRSTTQRTAGASANPARPPVPQPTHEDLGTQVIEGTEARGERIIRTIPEGVEGNDRPIQIIQEIWRSVQQPSVILMMTMNDPRHGETLTHLTNVVLDEPPAELFQVPADYTIKELQTVAKPETPSE